MSSFKLEAEICLEKRVKSSRSAFVFVRLSACVFAGLLPACLKFGKVLAQVVGTIFVFL